MTQKFYARQIAPEYQISPFWDTIENETGIILDGNSRISGYMPDEYQHIWDAFDDAAQEIENQDMKNGYAAYSSATEAIQAYFPASEYRSSGRYSTRDIHAIREALRLYGTRDYYQGDYILNMLDALTGHDWRYIELRGCCQGDWQGCYYDSTLWSPDALRALEIEYFNLGEEWMIHDDETEPGCPEDITGYSVYITGDDSRTELADVIGCDPEELKLYRFRGWTRSAAYEED